MKLLLVTFLAMLLFIPSIVIPQVSRFSYGSGMGAPHHLVRWAPR
jgi:hypothetical protein